MAEAIGAVCAACALRSHSNLKLLHQPLVPGRLLPVSASVEAWQRHDGSDKHDGIRRIPLKAGRGKAGHGRERMDREWAATSISRSHLFLFSALLFHNKAACVPATQQRPDLHAQVCSGSSPSSCFKRYVRSDRINEIRSNVAETGSRDSGTQKKGKQD